MGCTGTQESICEERGTSLFKRARQFALLLLSGVALLSLWGAEHTLASWFESPSTPEIGLNQTSPDPRTAEATLSHPRAQTSGRTPSAPSLTLSTDPFAETAVTAVNPPGVTSSETPRDDESDEVEPAGILVPSFHNLNYGEARTQARALGLVVRRRGQIPTIFTRVRRQSVEAGQRVEAGTRIDLHLRAPEHLRFVTGY